MLFLYMSAWFLVVLLVILFYYGVVHYLNYFFGILALF